MDSNICYPGSSMGGLFRMDTLIIVLKWFVAPIAMGVVLLIGGPGDWLADKLTKR